MPSSIHADVMDAVKSALVDAGLAGIPEAQIYVQAVPDLSDIGKPALLVLLDGQRETCVPYSTEEDVRTLPVLVAMIDSQDRKSYATWLPQWLEWREKIINAFLAKTLATVPGCWLVDIESAGIIDAQRILGPRYEDATGGFMLKPQVITARIAPG